jgi:hypothetical protein
MKGVRQGMGKITKSQAISVGILGLVITAFFLVTVVLQIQTNEAWVTGATQASVSAFHPEWAVLLQPVTFVQGKMSTTEAIATMIGWGIELVNLVCIVAYDIAHHAVESSNKHISGWWKTIVLLIMAFNIYTDYRFGQVASGFWGQIAFAIIVTVVVFFFGIIGPRFVEHGFAGIAGP